MLSNPAYRVVRDACGADLDAVHSMILELAVFEKEEDQALPVPHKLHRRLH